MSRKFGSLMFPVDCSTPRSLSTDIMAFSFFHAIVSPEARDQYIPIIDSILAKSDLTTISSKTIRNGLQDEIGYDLTPHKVCAPDLSLLSHIALCSIDSRR